MVVLCFVVDISLLSFAALKAVKNCLLQFGNLCALRSSKGTGSSIADNGIGLSYISISNLSLEYELTVVQMPEEQPFDLRKFHHAVRSMPSSLLGMVNLDGFQYCKQVSSLLTLLNGEDGLLSWASNQAAVGVTTKVVIISSRFKESVTTFKQSLLEAADHFVTIEFIEIEQPETAGRNLKHDEIEQPDLEMMHDFATQVSEFENCTLHRVPFDPWTLMRLMKQWHQDIIFGIGGPVEAVLLFPVVLHATTNKVFCSFQPAVMQLADVLKPCKVCPCHGQPLETLVKAKPKAKESQLPLAVCGVTGQKLGTHALTDNGIMIGNGIILAMPYFKTVVPSPSNNFGQGNPVAFDVIKCISLDTLSEGLLFGLPYVVSPSSEVDHDIEAEADKIQDNEQIFAALLQDLHSRDCGLLCTSTINIESGEETAFLCFYILLPARNGSFSAKRLAGAEEIMVVPESASNIGDLEVCDELKCAVASGLSQLGTETYDPLRRLRGCHSKLTCLVKESLQSPRPVDLTTEKVLSRPKPGVSVSCEVELHTSENGLLPEGLPQPIAIHKDQQQQPIVSRLSLTSAAATPVSATPPEMILRHPPGTRKRACSGRLELQREFSFRLNPAGNSKGRRKTHQGLCYPSLPKPSMTNKPDPYSFSAQATRGTDLPLILPSKRFSNFKTARQLLLESTPKQPS